MKKNSENDSFWIVYADLMAGLFFVFMLLVGAIVVKYVFTQNSLDSTQTNLQKTQNLLDEKQKAILNLANNLKSQEQKSAELEALNKIFADKLDKLNLDLSSLKNQNSIFILQISDLENVIKKLENENFDLNKTIADLNLKNLEKNKTISQNELKIAFLLDSLSKKEIQFQQILQDLNTTKNRIRNLTGIKVKVIADIKEKLGDKVKIDPQSGALTLSSSVLFDKDSAVLKDTAKNDLKDTLKSYFDILLKSDDIRENLQNIAIVGFTDSDGSYIHNIKLSQQRAFSVMEFINSWNQDEKLQRYLTAIGRGYNELVLKNGKEDKDASRRIEIKFDISNQEAVNEIQKFLSIN